MSSSVVEDARSVRASRDNNPPTYFAISPLMLFPQTHGKFSVYLKIKDQFVLYAAGEEAFTPEHQRRLHENGVELVYVLREQKEQYERYVEDNLGEILANEQLPLKQRAGLFYETSTALIADTMERALPNPLTERRFNRVQKVVEAGIRFLMTTGSLKAMGSLISNDYRTYSHSVNVMVYTASILNSYDLEREVMFRWSLGAMLHDLGKALIPRPVLHRENTLAGEELVLFRSHPLKGVALCAHIPLPQESLNAILFHHERQDGKGYPSGMAGEDIPLPVRVISVADAYDRLTSERPFAPRLSPFEALVYMRDEMQGAFDMDVYKHLVAVLSGASIV
ncbi:MAG: HD domain-containing protein [Deltaproteobacteria bacterium]|nr:HD domain-containing protein [Deltaproteobacteria bacterium]